MTYRESYEATASKTIVDFLELREYTSFQAVGQLFHTQCIQYASYHPGNPLCFAISSRRWRSYGVGILRYSSPNKYVIPSTKFSKHDRVVVAPSWRYSSTVSAAIPYAKTWIAVVHFWNVERPNLPWTSFFCWKNWTSLEIRSIICMNNDLFILNCRRNKFAGYVRVSLK